MTEFETGSVVKARQVGWLDRPGATARAWHAWPQANQKFDWFRTRVNPRETPSFPMVLLLGTRSRTLPDCLLSIKPGDFLGLAH